MFSSINFKKYIVCPLHFQVVFIIWSNLLVSYILRAHWIDNLQIKQAQTTNNKLLNCIQDYLEFYRESFLGWELE